MLFYRKEIDGLRALSVISVIFYHAGFDFFEGGFIGVDVFFVISGYLITSLILKETEKNEFRLRDFYERRARRILPALFFIIFVSIPFAWILMPASQMKDFSESVGAVSIFLANILFMNQSGYFDTSADEKPLLHTWSLSVEEQFYLVFPIVFITFWRFGKDKVLFFISFLTLSSLLLSEWGSGYKADANFYFSPSRAWEILFGSISAFFAYYHSLKENNFIASIGVSLIVLSIFIFDKSTPFPSLFTLAPVIGATLIILFGSGNTLVARLLSGKRIVLIGLISYSAYLWHQPIFAFSRIYLQKNPNFFQYILLIICTFIFAYITWKFIEKPFRSKKLISRKRILFLTTSLTIFFLSFSYFGHIKNGFDANNLDYEADIKEKIEFKKPIYVIGDSHARHLIAGLEHFNSESIYNLTGSGCIPFRNIDRYDSRSKPKRCVEKINSNLDFLSKIKKESIVVISSMGPVYLDGTSFKGKGMGRVRGLKVESVVDKNLKDHYQIYEKGMRETLTELQKNQNLLLVFAIDIPELGISNGCNPENKELQLFNFTIEDLVVSKKPENCSSFRYEYDHRNKKYRSLIQNVLKDFPKVKLFDPVNYFCNKDICLGYVQGYGYLYRDFDHLSENGSLFYAERFLKEVKKSLKSE